MPPVNILIKPASGLCNMRCRYCFYADETRNRKTPIYGVMRQETMDNLIRKTLTYAEGQCGFGFQGGEPTLAGLDFFRTFVRLCKQYNTKRLHIGFSMQTNGFALDDAWAKFFHENNFLIGLSLDGPARINDYNRLDSQSESTFRQVMSAADLLRKNSVDFNVLSVVTQQSARHIEQIYRFFMNNGMAYQQYIPCLDPLGEPPGQRPYSLSAHRYGEFLCELFDLWLQDKRNGRFVYIRMFENIVGILRGSEPESCDMRGRCTSQFVTEADGSVYPCDFYVLDSMCMGNFNQHELSEIAANPIAQAFVEDSLEKDPSCADCVFSFVCRGGCRRHRQQHPSSPLGRNYLCGAYRMFYAYALPKLYTALGITTKTCKDSVT